MVIAYYIKIEKTLMVISHFLKSVLFNDVQFTCILFEDPGLEFSIFFLILVPFDESAYIVYT